MILSLLEAMNLVKAGVTTVAQIVQAVRDTRAAVQDDDGSTVDADRLERLLVGLVTAQTQASIHAATRLERRHPAEDDGA